MLIFLLTLENSENEPKFVTLYNRYREMVFIIGKRHLGSDEKSEDCVQDTFFYIARNFGKIGEIESAATKCYIATVAEGTAISIYRKEKKNRSTPFNDELYSGDDLNESFFEAFDEVELSYAMDSLTDEQKNMIYLKYIYGYTSKEIGKLYNISDSLVRMRIKKSLDMLRYRMEEK